MMKLAAFLLTAAISLSALIPAAAQEITAYSRVIDVPGVGEWQYYAQNDPLWANSIYEARKSTRYRPFREGGCGPTSAAIAISRHIHGAQLLTLMDSLNPAMDGLLFCSCSINGWRCDRSHELTLADTEAEFCERLPILLAGFACGNNSEKKKYRGEGVGTKLEFFPAIADAYRLEYHSSRHWEDAYAALQQGFSVITTVGKSVFTDESHYLVIAYADESWIYVLDPFMRTAEEYKEYDRRGVLEVIEPGLVRAKASSLSALGFSGFYMFGPQKQQ